jgi:tRNA (adenine37-N6)-methyltransferase
LPEATADWVREAPFVRDESAVTIPADVAAVLGETTTRLLRQMLRLDLQPAYQDDAARIYGMNLSGWNITWSPQAGNIVTVIAATTLTP